MDGAYLLDQAVADRTGWARLRNRIARLTRRDDAEDLLHDAWVGLKHRSIDVRNPEALLVRTATNHGIDAWRKERRIKGFIGDQLAAECVADSRPLQDEALIARQQLDGLRQGLAQLSPRTREIFLMHRLDGRKYREIAHELGISQSAVEKHIAKAMAHLLDWMERDERELPPQAG